MIEEFIANQSYETRKILEKLRVFLLEDFGLREKIRYRIPFYYGSNSWICYLNPRKKDKVEFVFLRGSELIDESRLLDSKGRKQVAGIEVENSSKIPFSILEELMQQAILLDESVPFRKNRI